MASIIWSDVSNFAPELATLNATAQTDILAHVNTALNVDEFGGESSARTRLARIFLAAHFGTISSSTGTGGQVIREQAGGLEREYAELSITAGGLEATSYGQMYIHLVRTSRARGPIVL